MDADAHMFSEPDEGRDTGSAVFSAKNASIGYSQTPVLTGITLSLSPGHALALIGPNGSGKTTLMRALLGSAQLISGKLSCPLDFLGYVPQNSDIDLSFPITVHQVVEMGMYPQAKLLRPLSREQKEAVSAALEQIGLAERARERFGTLSGGQRQRVLVARALVAKPGLVLLDEPFNGLDEPNREALLSLISQAKAQGTAFMISTHDYRVATQVCDESLIVAGRQVAYGPTSQVFRPEIINEAFGGIHNV
ncbi:metal ABC transporter ATP-binding protein [uncultured Actinomyces sp.]|uniref:metal ABC transporter ATP-binding protein n=1 Tax=uncultured Actinomyces sp. TaxID=249061 RepID=UPI0028E46B08|nr:metal ABC transporter ATP-binding protein [uncultured Actinomyces sp.]